MTNVDANRVLPFMQLIMNRWAQTHQFQYTIRSDSPIKGVPIDEIRDARFWVGVGDEGGRLTLLEAVVLFRLVADQAQQLKRLKGQNVAKKKIESKIRTQPTDDDIRWFLANASIDEALDASDDRNA